jgi:hypothetical protein
MTRRAAAALVAALTAVVVAPSAPAADREPLDIRIFARIPAPGQPEPVAIGPREQVFVGTNQQGKGDADARSKIFVYSRDGRPIRAIELRGQNLAQDHGIQGLAFDGRWRLYVLDRAARARVVRINLRTGRQRDYATFRDVPSCTVAGRETECSATVGDMPPAPNYAAFAPDGSLYVTDIEQALIWRVPPNGGEPEVWFTDPRLENIFGPNGIQLLGDGRTILFAAPRRDRSPGIPRRERSSGCRSATTGHPASCGRSGTAGPSTDPMASPSANPGRSTSRLPAPTSSPLSPLRDRS